MGASQEWTDASMDAAVARLNQMLEIESMRNPGGTLTLLEDTFKRFDKVRVEVRGDEHPPPHFHVVDGSRDASFRVDNGEYIVGDISRSLAKVIKSWFPGAMRVVAEAWNNSRPTDCPVGPVPLPEAAS